MTAPLDVKAARAEWEGRHPVVHGRPLCFCSQAADLVPRLLDHIDLLHQAIRRAVTDRDITHAGAYLNTILDEVTL